MQLAEEEPGNRFEPGEGSGHQITRASKPSRGNQWPRSRRLPDELLTGRKESAMRSLLREVIGDVLRRARTTQRRTLREVSDAARVSLGYLSEVERGRKEASSELLSAICDALDVPLSQLLVDAGEQLARANGAQGLSKVATASAANIDASTKVVIPPVVSMAVA
jgi:transcriptional regulator with XRE-family HTH domain